MPEVYPLRDPVEKDFKNLHVVTSFFNPCGYYRLLENYWQFRNNLSSNAKLHTIELLFNGSEPEIPDALHVNGSTVLWHKEALLNILIEQLPEDVDAIAWIDADILFTNPHWVEDSLRALKQWKVIQPFNVCSNVFPDGNEQFYKLSTGYLFNSRITPWNDFRISHPGFAWVARAEDLRKTLLSDIHIIGGGDMFMLEAFTSRPLFQQSRMNEHYRRDFRSWSTNAKQVFNKSFGYIEGGARHLWHGEKSNRRYIDRYQDISLYNPTHDLVRDHSGLWKWSDSAPAELIENLKNHFKVRNDDSDYRTSLHN